MGFPDLFKLEKLKVHAFSDVARSSEIPDSPFEAMFNPQSLTQTYGIRYDPGKDHGGTEQSATFVRTNPSSLSLTLLLDGTGVEEMGLVNLFSTTVTVQDRIDNFLAIAYFAQSDSHEPSFLQSQMGRHRLSVPVDERDRQLHELRPRWVRLACRAGYHADVGR